MDATAKTEDTKPAEKRENENGTEESTENGEQQPAKKVKTEEADKDQIKVGVLPEGFPDDVMTQDQVEKVKEAILDKIIEMDDSQVKPKFLRAINRSDYLALTCANEDTLTWLENEISSIQPWEDCKLKIEKGDSFPTSEVLYADLPKSQDYTTEKMLKLIDGQNEGLSATSWKVVSKSTGGTMVELIVKVPPAIMQKLKEMDYKVNYKFGTVRIGPKEKPKAPPKASGGKPKQRFVPKPLMDRPVSFTPPRGMGGSRGGYRDGFYGANDRYNDLRGGPRGQYPYGGGRQGGQWRGGY